jgi:transposase
MTGNERRRKWTVEDKQAILAEAFAPGASPIEVARRADISTGQLYTWRKELWKPAPPPAFAQVVTLPDRMPELDADRLAGRYIEIIFGSITARIPATTSPELAAAIIAAMVAQR